MSMESGKVGGDQHSTHLCLPTPSCSAVANRLGHSSTMQSTLNSCSTMQQHNAYKSSQQNQQHHHRRIATDGADQTSGLSSPSSSPVDYSSPGRSPQFSTQETTQSTKSQLEINIKVNDSSRRKSIDDVTIAPTGQELTFLVQQAMQSQRAVENRFQSGGMEMKQTTNAAISLSMDETHSDSVKSMQNHMAASTPLETSLMAIVEETGSDKNSPHSVKTSGDEVYSPNSTEPPSMPSDKADSHGHSDGKCSEALANVLEFGDETLPSVAADTTHTTTSSADTTGITQSMSDDYPNKEGQDTPQSGSSVCHSPAGKSISMRRLEDTIDSVLEKIRDGRGNEVEYNPAIRAQLHLPQPSKVCDTPLSSHSENRPPPSISFSPRPQSPRISQNQMTSPTGPRGESSAYLAQRQRIQSALDQVSTSYYIHPGGQSSQYPLGPPHGGQMNAHSNMMYMKQSGQQPSPGLSYPPSGLPPNHLYLSGPPSGNFMPNQQTGPMPSGGRRPQHPGNVYMHHPSMMPCGQKSVPYVRHLSMQQSSQHLGQPPPFHPHSGVYQGMGMCPPGYMHQGTKPSNAGQPLPGSSYYHPSIPGPQGYPASPYMHSQGVSMPPNVMRQPNTPHVAPNMQEQKSVYTTGTPANHSPVFNDTKSSQNLPYRVDQSGVVAQAPSPGFNPASINYARTSPKVQQQRMFQYPSMTSTPIPAAPVDVQQQQQALLMPPPRGATFNMPLVGKKRSMVMGKGSSNKRRRTSLYYALEGGQQVTPSYQPTWEEILDQLYVPNTSGLLQDPLVTTTLSLIPPRGGKFLGNIIHASEAEYNSKDIFEKPKKYKLPPFSPKYVRPNAHDSVKGNAYLVQHLANAKVPEGPIIGGFDSSRSERESDTPENPVIATPEPQTSGQTLLAMVSQQPTSRSPTDRATPPIPMVYPLLVQACLSGGLIISRSKASTPRDLPDHHPCESDGCSEPKRHCENTIRRCSEPDLTSSLHGKMFCNNNERIDSLPRDDSKCLRFTLQLNSLASSDVPMATHTQKLESVVGMKAESSGRLESGMAPGDGKYSEEPVSVASLIALKKQDCCRHCEMPLVGSQGIRRKSEDLLSASKSETLNSAELIFCSVNCLTQFSQSVPTGDNSESDPDGQNSIEFCQQLYVGDKPSTVPVMIRGPIPKITKAALKRQASLERHYGQRHRISGESNGYGNSLSAFSSGKPPLKRWRGIRWRRYSLDSNPAKFYHDMSDRDIRDLMVRCSPALHGPMDGSSIEDTRVCALCKGKGDAPEEVAGRLLNLDADLWLHLNCALWCFDVYETVSGALVDVESSYPRAVKNMCVFCGQYGSGLPCFRNRCPGMYHLPCAYAAGCMFFTDRGMYCPAHKIRDHPLHLPSLVVHRRVFISRDESAQVASVVLDDEHKTMTLRIGSIIMHQVGQLLPEQLASGNFNSNFCIYPIGFRTTRIYWSSRNVNRRCRYECSIEEWCGRPKFVVTIREEGQETETIEGVDCDVLWKALLRRIASFREEAGLIRLFPEHIRGEDLFGLTEPHIVRAIESLPGVESLKNYAFKFGRLQLITEMPLAVNPTGCARSEPKLRTYVRRTACAVQSVVRHASHLMDSSGADSTLLYSRLHPLHGSKTQQYRRLRAEWKTNVSLGRSRIQGLGLFTARNIEKYTMIIEYLGEVIRNEVANKREKLYEAQNRGVYMFRVDDDYVVDATMCGGLARYINHSCEPNCTAEIVNFEGNSHIVLLANRKVEKGEELTYDYHFDYEDRSNKIPCLCGTPSCRKWMN